MPRVDVAGPVMSSVGNVRKRDYFVKEDRVVEAPALRGKGSEARG